VSAKTIAIPVVALVVGFAAGYGTATWHANKPDPGWGETARQSDRVFYDGPPSSAQWGEQEVPPSEQDYFVKTLEHTHAIVVMPHIKLLDMRSRPRRVGSMLLYPDVYRVILDPAEVRNIVRATKIRYKREPNMMGEIGAIYQVVFFSTTGTYRINYERFSGGASVIDLAPVTLKYDRQGRINGFDYPAGATLKYIQAYPSRELQLVLERYITG
jgi:hypothetical protein